MSRKIAVLVAEPPATEDLQRGGAADIEAIADVLDTADSVIAACRSLGWSAEAVRLPLNPRATLGKLAAIEADVIVNLAEEWGGSSRFEAAIVWVLEMMGATYTGAPPATLSLALDKGLAKALMRGRNIPTPPGLVYPDEAARIETLRFPCIVKPVREDASHGIDADNVVLDAQAARRRAERILTDYRQPALIEEFIDGREFSVAIVGEGDHAEALPLRETFFAGYEPGRPRIVTYSAKWEIGSPDEMGYDAGPAAPLGPGLERRIIDTALAAYRVFGLRDYGRVDIRLDPENGPFVIDINPNPTLASGVGSAASAEHGGLSYEQFIARIIGYAWERRHPNPRAPAVGPGSD